MTVASFMKSVLATPRIGYYSKDSTLIGASGDFITSPEVSQIFGQVVACWLASQMQEGRKYSIIELGPGNGTLIRDVLTTLRDTHRLDMIEEVKLVECSDHMKGLQRQTLDGIGTPITFLESLSSDPASYRDSNVLLLAHEFFDALPAHAFKRDSLTDKWSEVLVDFDYEFKMVSSPGPTVASKYLRVDRMFPSKLRSLELSPESWRLAQEIADIGGQAGHCAGLIIDYGQWGPSTGSFRAIHKHQVLASPLHMVGDADLSVDVDFYALSFYLSKHLRSTFMTQREFLVGNWAQQRARKLIACNPSLGTQIDLDLHRLTECMGSSYKVLAFDNKPGYQD